MYIIDGIAYAGDKNNSVEYYLSKGCDRAAAEYYASGRKKIV